MSDSVVINLFHTPKATAAHFYHLKRLPSQSRADASTSAYSEKLYLAP
jgi:hypothetical protein